MHELQALQERSHNDRKLNEWSLSNPNYIRKSLVGPKINTIMEKFQEKFLVTRLESFLLTLLQQCSKHVDILETKDKWRRFAPPFFLSPHRSKQTLKKNIRHWRSKVRRDCSSPALQSSNSCRTQLRSHRKYYEYHYWETFELVCTMVIAQSLQRFAVWLHQQEELTVNKSFWYTICSQKSGEELVYSLVPRPLKILSRSCGENSGVAWERGYPGYTCWCFNVTLFHVLLLCSFFEAKKLSKKVTISKGPKHL